MDEAWRLDKESFERKQPALHKLKLLPYVDRTLRKEYMQENFLEKDGLDYIEKWLSKMPDGASPSQTIKKKLLEIIYFLPVTFCSGVLFSIWVLCNLCKTTYLNMECD